MDNDIIKGAGTDWLRLAQAAFQDSTNYLNAGIRREIEQDIRQFQGLHPSGSKYLSDAYKTRSRFFRPKTRTVIRKNEAVAAAALFSNTDVVEIEPWDDGDDMQRASARMLKELLNLRLKKTIPWFLISIGAYQDAQAVGLCCSYQTWKFDPKKGIDQPSIELIPIENIRFSPGAQWHDVVNTSPYFIRLIPMYVKDVQARMKQGEDKPAGQKWKRLEDGEILKALQSHSDSIRLQRETGRSDSQASGSTINPYQIVWVHQNIAEIDGEDWLWYTLGDTALLTNGVRLKEKYWHGRRPYVIGYSVIETHKVYPGGVSRITRDVQGELNENANQRLDNVKFAMNKRYFAKRNAQVDLASMTRNVPSSVTLMNDPEKDVKIVETGDVTRSAYEEQDRLGNDMDELSGSFSQSSVQGNKALSDRLGGMEMLSEDANAIQGYQLRTWVETWVEPVLYQIMLLEQHYETDSKVLVLAGKKANLGQEDGQSDITDELLTQELGLTVHVGVGATSPRKQLDNLLFAFKTIVDVLKDGVLDKYGLEPGEFINEVFGKLGYRDGARFFDWDQQDPTVAALQKQVQELQQALEAKHPPALIEAQVKKIDAEIKKIDADRVKTGVEAAFGAMEAGEVIATVPDVAPIADAVMQAAGYVKPNPPGIDPGFSDQPLAQATATVPDAGARMPADASGNLRPPVPESTNPLTPKGPSSPFQGFNKGIESGGANARRPRTRQEFADDAAHQRQKDLIEHTERVKAEHATKLKAHEHQLAREAMQEQRGHQVEDRDFARAAQVEDRDTLRSHAVDDRDTLRSHTVEDRDLGRMAQVEDRDFTRGAQVEDRDVLRSHAVEDREVTRSRAVEDRNFASENEGKSREREDAKQGEAHKREAKSIAEAHERAIDLETKRAAIKAAVESVRSAQSKDMEDGKQDLKGDKMEKLLNDTAAKFEVTLKALIDALNKPKPDVKIVRDKDGNAKLLQQR